MQFELDESQRAIVEAVDKVCAQFDDAYWLNKDNTHEFPFEFHRAIADILTANPNIGDGSALPCRRTTGARVLASPRRRC